LYKTATKYIVKNFIKIQLKLSTCYLTSSSGDAGLVGWLLVLTAFVLLVVDEEMNSKISKKIFNTEF